MADSLTKTAFSALRWNYVGFVVRSVSTFVVGIVLARLLGPKPFGEVATVALVFGLANQFADGGFSAALVQAAQLTTLEIRFAFTIQVLGGAAITTATIVAAPFIASAFQDPALQAILRVVAPLFLLQSFGQTSTGLLKRRLQHKTVQRAQIISYLVGYVLVGIPAACRGAGVWSLVGAQLVQSLLYSVQVYARILHSIVPSLSRSGARLFGFGTKIAGANVVNWSISNLDNAVVGHGFGSTVLGLYSRAFSLASVPADGIVSTCQQVLFASCSRAAHQAASIRRAYLASVAAIAIILLPVYWSLAVSSNTVVAALYGSRWAPIAPLFSVFAIALPVNALMALAGPLLSAMDHVKVELRAQAISLLFAAIAFITASRFSPTAVSWAVLLAYAFRYFAVTSPALRLLDLTWRDVVRVIRGPMLAAFTTATLVLTVNSVMTAYKIPVALAIATDALTGIATCSLLLKLAAEFILAPELVSLAITGAPKLPKLITATLDDIRSRQARVLRNRNSSAAIDNRQAGAADLYIATLLEQTGETGVQTHFNVLRQHLEQNGLSAEVLTPYEAPSQLRRPLGLMRRLVRLSSAEAGTYVDRLAAGWCLRYRMRRRLPRNAAWTVYAQCHTSALTALQCRTRPDQKVIQVVHFNLSQATEMAENGRIRRGGWVYRWIQSAERQALLAADQIIYCSHFMHRHLSSIVEELDRRPSAMVHNFVTVPPLSTDGIRGDIITIGTLEPRKNQGALLYILAEAKRLGRIYSLTIVGRGPSEASFRKLAEELGVSVQVTFAGFVPEAARWLHRHRLYAHTAKMENLPITLIEALSVGLPVLAPAVGGIPEIITDGLEGILWDVTDVQACARALISVLDDEPVYRSMSAAGRRKYQAEFRAEERAAELWSLLFGCKATSQETGKMSSGLGAALNGWSSRNADAERTEKCTNAEASF